MNSRHCERKRSNPGGAAALDCFVAALLAMTMSATAQARDIEMGGDSNYPYSIMAPEPGTGHHRGAASARSRQLKSPGAEKPLAARPPRASSYGVRGSSGLVLPT